MGSRSRRVSVYSKRTTSRQRCASWERPSKRFYSDLNFTTSWLCENAKPLKDDRRSYSSKTASGHQLAIAFNFNIELKNVILVAFRTFAFLHSQVKSHTSGSADAVAPAAVGVADGELVVGIGVEADIGVHPHAHATAQLQAVGLLQ